MPIDLNDDFQVLVATLSGEAESESLAGKQAVAAAIVNRTHLAAVHPHFGDGSIRSACLAHDQFSCWLPGPDHDRIMALDLSKPSPALQDCITVARTAVAGTLEDPTGGATHYFAPYIAAPEWVAEARWKGVHGSQLFWGDVK